VSFSRGGGVYRGRQEVFFVSFCTFAWGDFSFLKRKEFSSLCSWGGGGFFKKGVFLSAFLEEILLRRLFSK